MTTSERLLTPSKITAWLECPHYLSLQNLVDGGQVTIERRPFGSLAQLLADKGLKHEADCLAAYRAASKSVLEIPQRQKTERFAAWVERVGNPFDQGFDVIYQMPLVHQGVRGIADFLIRVEDPNTGQSGYEPVDAKLARTEAKPGHVLQLCFYVDAIEAITGHTAEQMHLWLGSGRVESLAPREVRPYWRRLRAQLAALLDDDAAAASTTAEPCGHCGYCEFVDRCESEWRDADSLIYVAGIRQLEREALVTAGVATLADLSTRTDTVDDVRPERLLRLVEQAVLQVQARSTNSEVPPFHLIPPGPDPVWGHGFSLLPEPDDGDVFLDFEGHPFWRADAGLFFLFGLIEQDDHGEWAYRTWWAHDLPEEAAATVALIDYLAARRDAYPGMHVYHYNHTERSSLERLAQDHGVGEVALARIVETGCFIDLLVVARNALVVGTESYGLKYLERLTPYERGHDIDQGAGAVVEYEAYTLTGDQTLLDRIAAYNEDDVRATRALRDWLVDHRPAAPWRAAFLEPDEGLPELDAQVEALHAFGPETPEHLLGDLLEYWRREWFAHLAPLLVRSQADPTTLLEDPDVIAGLSGGEVVERTTAKGAPRTPVMRLQVPVQDLGAFKADGGDQLIYTTLDGLVGYSNVAAFDAEAGTVDITWSEKSQELGTIPGVLVLNDWVRPNPKPDSLSALAAAVLDPSAGSPNPASLALLQRDFPRFSAGEGPSGGVFTDDLDEMTKWVLHLDQTFVAIQGPPGTGKTYSGSHLIHSLLKGGKRVGINAMSHSAIDNLLQATVELLEEEGDLDLLNGVRKGSEPTTGALPSITYTSSNPKCGKTDFNLVAGTTWLFAGQDMADSPVDVLVIDEAGQLALADALAASRSAHSVVLLGDPLQLPQVAQASHPHGSGASVLEHILGDDATIPEKRGVFLSETRRMHPDVCKFISDEIYESRLTSHPSCAVQTTVLGTGLRWLRADHVARSTECEEEAELVAAEIRRLLGTSWTNHHGVSAPLTATDFMVVAPYNDQVHLLRAHLDSDAATAGAQVGTVDKFQGRQAAVVFFTMTTSSPADMPRGAEFLFSRNRLNVAISRARCLAYLVCTENLLNTRAKSVPDMRLISSLCSLVEHAQ